MTSTKIKQPNIWGRIGSGIGEGFSQNFSKEVERGRLASGLKQFEQESGNLTPMQQLARLAPLVSEYPQLVQSFGDLAKRSSQIKGLQQAGNAQQQAGAQPRQQPEINLNIPGETSANQQPTQTPSVTSRTPLEATLKPYIPLNHNERLAEANKLLQQNPQLYPDVQSAMQGVNDQEKANQDINNALQGQRNAELGVQQNLENEIKSAVKDANAQIPDNVFQEIRNEAYDDILTGKKTEKQAADAARKKADLISREYNEVKKLGGLGMIGISPKEVLRTVGASQKKFKERGDLENFADTLVGKNGLTDSKAYYLAYPPEQSPVIYNELKNLKHTKELKESRKLNAMGGILGGDALTNASPRTIQKATLEFSEKLGPMLKDSEASPLAIAEELKAKGYNPDTWMKYLTDNERKLNLSARQSREIQKPRSWFPSLNDMYLFILGRKEKYVED